MAVVQQSWFPDTVQPVATVRGWRSLHVRTLQRSALRRYGVLLAGFLLSAMAIAYAVFWLQPPGKTRLVIIQATYDDVPTIPQNATGANGVDGIINTVRNNPDGHRRGRMQTDAQPKRLTRGQAQQMFDEIATFRDSTIVLLISAHGASDGEGPYLIPDDATPIIAHRIRITTILESLARLPAKTRKLLIFDATQPEAVPAVGAYDNDFARGLESLEPKIQAIPNLVVFQSSSAFEQSIINPERGTTAFLYYLQRGLAGAADANDDNRLTALEWLDYTTERTQAWSRDHRQQCQTPNYLPRGEEGRKRAGKIHVTIAPGHPGEEPLPEPFAVPAEYKRIHEEYRKLPEFNTLGLQLYPVVLYRYYLARLHRYEELMLAGCKTALPDELKRIERDRQELIRQRRIDSPSISLAFPIAMGAIPTVTLADAGKAIEGLTQADDTSARWQQMRTPFDSGDRIANYCMLGRALAEWVAVDPANRLKRADSLIDLILPGFNFPPVELMFVRSLARHLPPEPPTSKLWPSVREAILVRLLAERSTLHHFDEMREANQRRSAEDHLFTSDNQLWELAFEELDNARSVCEGYAITNRLYDMPLRPEWPSPNAKQLLNDTPNSSRPRSEILHWMRRTREFFQDTRYLGIPKLFESQTIERLIVEYRNVSRQLEILQRTHPEPVTLPDLNTIETEFIQSSVARASLDIPRIYFREDKAKSDEISELSGKLSANTKDRRKLLDRVSQLFDNVYQQLQSGYQFHPAKREDRIRDISIPAVTVLSYGINPSNDPTVVYRNWRISEYLLNLAKRTHNENVRSDVAGKAHSVEAIRELSKLALRLYPIPADLPEFTKRLDAISPPTFPAIINGPKQFVITDQPSPVLPFDIKTGKSNDTMPTYYIRDPSANVDQSLRIHKDNDQPLAFPATLRKGALPLIPTRETQNLELDVYFRGGILKHPFTVDRYPVPEYVAKNIPTPDNVSIAVRADPAIHARFGRAAGTVHFVIDASGSMRAIPDKPGHIGLYAESVDLMEKILKELPAGLTLKITVFGSRNPAATSPDNNAIEVVNVSDWPADPAKQIESIIATLRGIEPWDHSAIVSNVLRSHKPLAKESGFRAIVVLTDGLDTRFNTDDNANPKKISAVEAIRQTFSDTGVSLHVVAFPLKDKGDSATQESWRIVEKLSPAGLFLRPKDAGDLVKALRSAALPRVRCKIAPINGPAIDITAGSPGSDNWPSVLLKPDMYRVTAELGSNVATLVALNPGERIVLNLADEQTGPQFRIVQHTNDAAVVVRKTSGDWTSALLNQRLTSEGQWLGSLAIDRRGNVEVPLNPSRIGDLLIEVKPVASQQPVALQWQRRFDVPAPAWSLRINGWPSSASPKVATWWKPEGPFTALQSVKVHNDNFNVDTPLGKVTIESINIEDVILEDKAIPQKALVIRVIHPPGESVWARPNGWKYTGSMIRTFEEANRTTAIYWSNSIPKVTDIELISKTRAKKECESQGNHAVMDGIPAPR